MDIQHNNGLERYKTVKQVVDMCPAFTVSGLRAAIFYNRDGFEDKCVRRFGRKVLVDVDALDTWLGRSS